MIKTLILGLFMLVISFLLTSNMTFGQTTNSMQITQQQSQQVYCNGS